MISIFSLDGHVLEVKAPLQPYPLKDILDLLALIPLDQRPPISRALHNEHKPRPGVDCHFEFQISTVCGHSISSKVL